MLLPVEFVAETTLLYSTFGYSCQGHQTDYDYKCCYLLSLLLRQLSGNPRLDTVVRATKLTLTTSVVTYLVCC
jgi:hypothetical protein